MKKLIYPFSVAFVALLFTVGIVRAAFDTTSPRTMIPVDTTPTPTKYLVDIPMNVSGTITQNGTAVGFGTVATSGALTANTLTKATAFSTIANSILSESAGGIAQNATQITDGGGNIATNIVQPTGAGVIIQAPTGTAVLGGLVQSGVLTKFSSSTTLVDSNFCGTGHGIVQDTTSSIVITVPATSTISGFSCNTGNKKIFAGSWGTQLIYNNSTNSVSYATTGDSEVSIYSAGTSNSQPPGTLMTITGLFSSSSQTQFATGTGQTLYLIYTLFQTSTPFTVSGNTASFASTAIINASSGINQSGGVNSLASTTISGQATTTNLYVSGVVNIATTTNTEPLTLQGNQRINAGQIYETVFDNGSTTASTTVFDWNNGNKQIWALGAATTTINLSNCKSGGSYTGWLMQDGTGSRTATWQTTGTCRIQWVNGNTAPTLSTGANTMDAISFQCFTPHTTTTLSCYGMYSSGNFAQ